MSPSPVLQSQSLTQGQTQVMPGSETGPLLFQDYTLNPNAWDELFAARDRAMTIARNCSIAWDASMSVSSSSGGRPRTWRS